MYRARVELLAAAQDYRWLLDRGYPDSSALKLVGDRFALTRDERLILFRGVAGSEASRSRRSLLVRETAKRRLLVDGHNQGFTVMHHLTGRPLFIGSDGLLRDVGASHGHIADPAVFSRALLILAEALARAAPGSVAAWFDAPITGSADHAELFARSLRDRGLDASVALEKSADAPLKAAAAGELVATGDSAVIAALAWRFAGLRPPEAPGVFDAARFALETAFGQELPEPRWLDLGAALDGAGMEDS